MKRKNNFSAAGKMSWDNRILGGREIRDKIKINSGYFLNFVIKINIYMIIGTSSQLINISGIL